MKSSLGVIAAGLLLAGCSTWADERAATYYQMYGECLNGKYVWKGYPASEREKKCLEMYERNLDGLNAALNSGHINVQPVYIGGSFTGR